MLTWGESTKQHPQFWHLGNFRLKQAGDIGNSPLRKPIELEAEECARTSEWRAVWLFDDALNSGLKASWISPRSRILLENPRYRKPVNEFPQILWDPKVRYCVHKTPPPKIFPILSQINPVQVCVCHSNGREDRVVCDTLRRNRVENCRRLGRILHSCYRASLQITDYGFILTLLRSGLQNLHETYQCWTYSRRLLMMDK